MTALALYLILGLLLALFFAMCFIVHLISRDPAKAIDRAQIGRIRKLEHDNSNLKSKVASRHPAMEIKLPASADIHWVKCNGGFGDDRQHGWVNTIGGWIRFTPATLATLRESAKKHGPPPKL